MIQEVHIQNFKAIYRGDLLPLQPFTVFIGNNGSGKSSVLEALRMLQKSVIGDFSAAFNEWGDLDKVRNYNAFLEQETSTEAGFKKIYEPIQVTLRAIVNKKNYYYTVKINLNRSGDYYVVEHEELACNDQPVFIAYAIDNEGNGLATFLKTQNNQPVEFTYQNNKLILNVAGLPILPNEFEVFKEYIKNWQFLYLNAHEMGKPFLQNRLERVIKLDYSGRNIAEYLLWLRAADKSSFEKLIQKMLFVLPYIKDIQPDITEKFNREIQVLLHEESENSKPLPGWLISSGTLRIMAILSMFETPQKPSVLFIDEVENGLDPRTLGLLLNEIQKVYTEQSMQVVLTTHSPYFLDLVPIESIIVSEKSAEGCTYSIPKDEESLTIWKQKFSPGKLYTMGILTK